MNTKLAGCLVNIERLNNLMDQQHLSAVVVRSGVNFTYLSGIAYPGSQGRHVDFSDSPREVYVIWPREGDPTLIIGDVAAPRAKRDSWITELIVYDDYEQTAVHATTAALKNMGLSASRIGLEKTVLSAIRWQEFQQSLPDAEIIDCTNLMNSVRWIKTPHEIEIQKTACDILDRVYIEVFSQATVGETERELHSRIIQGCISQGAEIVHGTLNVSRNNLLYLGEGDTEITKGDVIRTDYVSYYRGYPGHQSRTFVVGEPSPELKRSYQQYRDVHRMLIDKCRPSTKANEIYRLADETLFDLGFGHVGSMVGHSIGPWFHQQEPLLIANCDVPIEAGMVLAVEPYVGFWHLQDLVHVTSDVPRLLSDLFDTDKMFIVG